MSETDISTKAKYYDYVNFVVDCIEEEIENNPESYVSDIVFEQVDSCDIIMYYSYNTDILENSNLEPQEWKHSVSENDYWKDVIQTMAFDVFRQDVWQEVKNRNLDE